MSFVYGQYFVDPDERFLFIPILILVVGLLYIT